MIDAPGSARPPAASQLAELAEPAQPTQPSRGLWLVPSPPITGYRSFFTTERLIIYLVIPIGMVLMLGRPNLADAGLHDLVNHYLVMFTAMACYSGSFELAYVLWARAIPTPPERWKRLAGHAVTILVVTFVGAYLASWIVEAIWELPAARLRAQSLRPGFVIGGSILAVLVFSDERRAQALALERAAAAARIAALRAELSALQARTDPHFLFNSMNAVASLIPDDPPAAETMLVRLAGVFRYALDAGRHATVPLASELSAVRTYLAIEGVRFGDRLRYHLDVDPALDALPVPPLSLQPLIENAIRHGVSARRGATRLELRVLQRDARIVITVEDQPIDAVPDVRDVPAVPAVPAELPSSAPTSVATLAPARRDATPGAGSALSNLRARLALLHGDAAKLTAAAAPPAGWLVTIELPLGSVDPRAPA